MLGSSAGPADQTAQTGTTPVVLRVVLAVPRRRWAPRCKGVAGRLVVLGDLEWSSVGRGRAPSLLVKGSVPVVAWEPAFLSLGVRRIGTGGSDGRPDVRSPGE